MKSITTHLQHTAFCAAILGGALLFPLASHPAAAQAHDHNGGTTNQGGNNQGNADQGNNNQGDTNGGNTNRGNNAPLAPVAGTPSVAPTGEVSPLAAMDRLFLVRAAEGNLAEINLAQIAMRRAKAPSVKSVAQHIQTEHAQAQADLMTLMRAKGMTMPPMLGVTHQAAAQMLDKARGDNFDRMYIAQQVEDHENTIALFQTQLVAGQDADVKAYAARYLPAIVGHTVHLYNIAREVRAPGIELRPAMPPTPPGVTPDVKPLPAPMER